MSSLRFNFVPARPEDFDYFYALRRTTMLEHFTRAGKIWNEDELVLHRRNFDPETLRMIYVGGKRVGFVNITSTEKEIAVSFFCIEPDFQNQGIGKCVTESILAEADHVQKLVTLNVLKGSPAARLYERLGFVVTAQKHDLLDYYQRLPHSRESTPAP